jgi:hypothetical protein
MTPTLLLCRELLTATYWDTVAEEIDEALQETGQVSVGELARQYNVGVDLLTGAITARLDMTVRFTSVILVMSCTICP